MAASSRFEIFAFSAKNLSKLLSNQHCPAAQVSKHLQAQYLEGYLKELGARTIVVESDYIDGDYLEDYASYYVKCFIKYERRCKRLHFFSVDRSTLSTSTFLRLVRGQLSRALDESVRNSYLGFVVAKPLPEAIIGKTLLKTYGSERGRRNYPCVRKYEVNLFGLNLEINSLAFQEQDTVLAACATVAAWCCLHKTGSLFGTPIPTPAEITRFANQVVSYSRPIPSHGLNVAQICNAVRQTGLEAEVITVKGETPVLSIIYAHLKMGLPVILGVDIEGQGGHAITVCGYSLKRRRVRAHEVAANEKCIPFPGLRIDKLFVHDDQIGPFARLEAMPSSTVGPNIFPVTFKGSWVDPSSEKRLNLYPTVLIIPVYRKIRVTFWDICQWLSRLDTVLPTVLRKSEKVEWDVNLTMLNDYKSRLRVSKSLGKADLERTLLAQHPRFIWKATLKVDNRPMLELLADATDMPRGFPFYERFWLDSAFRETAISILNLASIQGRLKEILTSRFLEFLLS